MKKTEGVGRKDREIMRRKEKKKEYSNDEYQIWRGCKRNKRGGKERNHKGRKGRR